MAYIYVAFAALAIGGLMGLLQTLVRSGRLELPGGINYYEILTAHGVLLGLGLTTYFILGFNLQLLAVQLELYLQKLDYQVG